jgi:hypothetical protein
VKTKRILLIGTALTTLVAAGVVGRSTAQDATQFEAGHIEALPGEDWDDIARRLSPSGVTRAQLDAFGDAIRVANGSPRSPRAGQILHYDPADIPTPTTATTATPTTAAPTTAAPTTAAPTTAAPTTAAPTTAAPTTAAPTTAAPTTAPPATAPGGRAPQFFEDFAQESGVQRFDRMVHHRNLALGGGGHDFDETWSGDHNLQCEGPTTQRIVRPSRDGTDPEAFWWCAPGNDPAKGHFMTSMGDIDGFTVVAFSPRQTMQDVTSVCWDVNLTDLGARKWFEVTIVPEQAFQANRRSLAYTHPTFRQPSVNEFPAGSFSFVFFNHDVILYNGTDRVYAESGSGFGTNDKARRYKHCLVDNGDGTVTATQERNNGTHTARARGSFPDGPARVIFTDQTYHPDKDGTPQGLTWHWDNIEIR